MIAAKLKALIPQLRRYCFSMTGNIDDADDLVQATLERLLSRPKPEDVDELRWVFRISSNLWIDEYRARKIRKIDTQAIEETEHTMTNDPTHHAVTMQQVNNALALLPAEQRQILSLIALKGMSYQDVAEILQIPIGTVMSRTARARTNMAQLMLEASGGNT